MLVHVITLALLLVLTAMLFWTFQQVWGFRVLAFEVHDSVREEIKKAYTQMEGLIGLYLDLGLRSSLPTRGWAASPDLLQRIVEHVRTREEFIVGCSSGVSAVVLARCLQRGGKEHVWSLEHDARYAEATREHLRRHALEEWATVLDAPLVPHSFGGESWRWYDLSHLPSRQIDVLVVDGPPMDTGRMARSPAGPALFSRLTAGAAVFLDDADRSGEQENAAPVRAGIPEPPATRSALRKGRCSSESAGAARIGPPPPSLSAPREHRSEAGVAFARLPLTWRTAKRASRPRQLRFGSRSGGACSPTRTCCSSGCTR